MAQAEEVFGISPQEFESAIDAGSKRYFAKVYVG